MSTWRSVGLILGLLVAAGGWRAMADAPPAKAGLDEIKLEKPGEDGRLISAADGAVGRVRMMPTEAGEKPLASPTPTPTPKPGDLTTTMMLNLNNASIDQIIQFLTDALGKPVLKNKQVNAQITISSPVPVTRRRALELIYDALLMDNVYIIELDNQVQIVPADQIKGIRLRTIGPDEDVQKLPDTLEVAQKVYKLKNLTAEDLTNELKKFVPESVISSDSHANTLVLTDRIGRLKYYDRIIGSLDRATTTGQTVEIIKIEHGDAVQIAILVGKILGQANAGQSSGGGNQNQGDNGGSDFSRYFGGFGGGGSSSRRRSSSNSGSQDVPSITVGNVTIVPDPNMNWLVVSCPKDRLDEIKRLVAEFDVEPTDDVTTRLIDIHHIDVETVADAINQIFPDNANKAEKEQIRVVPTDDGTHLIVYSSEKNYKLIQDLVKNLDTGTAEKRETRTYKIKNVQVQDMADQLTKLFADKQAQSNPFFYYYGSDNQQKKDVTKPSFVPSPRNSMLLVLARPKDFDFIEKMIKELDVEVDAQVFEPHIYQIHNTDATELVKVLETIFKAKGDNTNDQNQNPFDYRWRSGDDSKKGAFDEIFGDVRFVVDNVTNRIVALASRPRDYDTIDKMVERLDSIDPEATEVMVYTLKYAKADELSDRLNNLFSEGAVQQPQQPWQQQNQNNQNNNSDKTNDQEQTKKTADAVRQVIYPWQSGGNDKKKDENERPINTMIGNVRVVPDLRSNKIMIAAPSIYFNALRNVIRQLDLPEPQVYITARIVEIAREADKRIGIRWTPDASSIDPAELENATTALGQLGLAQPLGSNGSSQVVSNLGNGRTVTSNLSRGGSVLGANVNLTLLIQLLIKNSNSKVISEPGISVNNNETGNIFFGSEFPFQTGSQTTDVGSVTQQTEYRPVGISLDITPHINLEGEVVLKADLENSQIREGVLVNGQIIKDERKFSTELAVDSNQTMVIGGIRLGDEEGINRHIPILGAIPGLKHIFGKDDRTSTIRELVFFITPEVLRNRADDDAVLKSTTERLHEKDAFQDRSLLPELK